MKLPYPIKTLWPQWFATFQVFLVALMLGATTGWIASTLGRLSSPNPPYEATKKQMSWLASIVSIGMPIGSIIAVLVTPLLGSKTVLYMCGLSFFFGYICLTVVNSIEIALVSLMFRGLGMGLLISSYPMYIGEIADPKIRGKLVSFIVNGMLIGWLLGNIMGTYLDLWMYGAILTIPNIMFLIAFPFIPNTPHYFIHKNKIVEANKSINWYNRSVDTKKQLDSLSEFLAATPLVSFFKTLRTRVFDTRANRKSITLLITLDCSTRLCGFPAIINYMEILFIEARINIIAPSSLVILVTLVGIVSSWVSLYTSDKFGRTSILFFSYITMALVQLCWGMHYHLLDLGIDEPNMQWTVLISAILFRIINAVGFQTTIPTLMSELLAPNIKNICTCMCILFGSACQFVVCKYFSSLMDHLTLKYTFYLMSGITLLFGIFFKLFVPETKGKTLQEIQVMLENGKNKSQTVTKNIRL